MQDKNQDTNVQEKNQETYQETNRETDTRESKNRNKIYDDVFHTIAHKLPHLFISLINYVFDKKIPLDSKIEMLPNEFPSQDGEKITDYVVKIEGALYHMECQSSPDGSMTIRMAEYDLRFALREIDKNQKERVVIRLPHSCVLYLRHSRNTPDKLEVVLENAEGDNLTHTIHVLKVQNISLDEIFSKNLLVLLPYYIMRYEKELPEYERSAEKREMFFSQIRVLESRLQTVTDTKPSSSIYEDLNQLVLDVAEYLLKDYGQTRKGVREIMSVTILPLPSDKLREAREEGRKEGREEMRVENEKIRIQFENMRMERENMRMDNEKMRMELDYYRKAYGTSPLS